MILFSKRLELAEEYKTWVNQPLKDGAKIKDCPLSVITFLISKGFILLPEDSVVLTKEEYLEQFEPFRKKIVDLTTVITRLTQELADERKETVRKYTEKVRALIDNAKEKLEMIFPKNDKFKQGYEKSVKDFEECILEFAKQYGVEIK